MLSAQVWQLKRDVGELSLHEMKLRSINSSLKEQEVFIGKRNCSCTVGACGNAASTTTTSSTTTGYASSTITTSSTTTECGIKNVECQIGNGADYSGETSQTVSGLTCQAWNVKIPHHHGFERLGGHNHCRNPDGEPGVWCYTTNPNKRWELCNVRQCSDCDKDCIGEPRDDDKLLFADGKTGSLWDGCVARGSFRVQCPRGYYPCNQLKANGKVFHCDTSCQGYGGKRNCSCTVGACGYASSTTTTFSTTTSTSTGNATSTTTTSSTTTDCIGEP